MLKQFIIKSLTTGLKVIQKHSPVILAAVGVAGFIGATVVAVKNTPKVNLVLQEKEEEKGEKLTKKEEVLTKAKVYLPTILLIVASTMCVGGSTFISHKRLMTTTALLVSGEKVYNEYKEAVKSEIGEEKAKEIDKKIVENKIEKEDYGNEHMIETGNGSTIFYDPLSNRYFKTRKTCIEEAVNKLNKDLLDSDWVYLNDLYEELNIPNIGLGSNIGWAYEFCGLLNISIFAIDSPWGEPIYTLDYNNEPLFDNRWC